jgi:hypothetical protein
MTGDSRIGEFIENDWSTAVFLFCGVCFSSKFSKPLITDVKGDRSSAKECGESFVSMQI